ncbi:hypothetical protein L204_105233 [Cryptococcus depauperatus]
MFNKSNDRKFQAPPSKLQVDEVFTDRLKRLDGAKTREYHPVHNDNLCGMGMKCTMSKTNRFLRKHYYSC